MAGFLISGVQHHNPMPKKQTPKTSTSLSRCQNMPGQNSELFPTASPKPKTLRNEDLTPLWHARSSWRVNRMIARDCFLLFCGHSRLTIKFLLIYLGMLTIARSEEH